MTGIHGTAAYGQNATHQMTEEALAERQAALHGDAGTEESFAVDIPPKQPTKVVLSVICHSTCKACVICSLCPVLSFHSLSCQLLEME